MMVERIFVISLIITAIHVVMWEGMLLERLGKRICSLLDRLHMSFLQKPLVTCNICMGGVYTLLIYPILYGWSWEIIPTMIGVIGMNTLIAAILKYIQE